MLLVPETKFDIINLLRKLIIFIFLDKTACKGRKCNLVSSGPEIFEMHHLCFMGGVEKSGSVQHFFSCKRKQQGDSRA